MLSESNTMSDHDINAEHHDDHDDHNHSATYWKVFFGLMICTAISTVVGIMISNGVFDGNELSGWGIMITVSCVKAFLVITTESHFRLISYFLLVDIWNHQHEVLLQTLVETSQYHESNNHHWNILTDMKPINDSDVYSAWLK